MISIHYDIDIISIWYRYDIDTISIQYRYNIDTWSIQYRYNIILWKSVIFRSQTIHFCIISWTQKFIFAILGSLTRSQTSNPDIAKMLVVDNEKVQKSTVWLRKIALFHKLDTVFLSFFLIIEWKLDNMIDNS